MSGIGEYLLIIAITWIVRSLGDLAVEKSKLTENKVDDIFANNLKKIASIFTFKKK